MITAPPPPSLRAPAVSRGPKRLRVLHVVKGLSPGGTERLLCSAAAARDRDSFDYEVAYVVPWHCELAPELAASGVPVHCVGSALPPARGVNRVMADPRWVLRLRRLLRERRYDVVHVHSPLVAGVVRPLVRRLGPGRPRLVTTEHNTWGSYVLPTRLLNCVTYGLNDARFAVSDEVRRSVSARLRPDTEILVHGLALEEARALRSERASVRAELGFHDDDIVVGTIANYRAQKAYPDLLAAARRAADANPRLRFVAVGHGPLEADVHAEHARIGLGERFLLLGHRPDAIRVLAGCDVFTLASHWEGFPVALMEALALGVPVVATAVGGVPDGVTDGVEGLLVPARRPEELATALVRLAGDEQLRARMGNAAATRGAEFDIRRAVTRIEATYRELAGRTAGAVELREMNRA